MDKWIQSSTNRPAVLKYHQSKIQNNNDCFGFWMSAKILVETQFSRTLYVVHDPRCAIPRATILGFRPGLEPQHSEI